MQVTAITPFLVDPGTGKNWLFVKVDTDAGIEILIGGAQDRRHSAASREPGRKHPATIDIMFLDEFCCKSGDNGGFAGPAHLIAGIKPVPAGGWVG